MSLPTTSLPTVVFLDRATIPRHIPLPALPFEHHWLEYDACEPQQVVERLLAADIVITNKWYSPVKCWFSYLSSS